VSKNKKLIIISMSSLVLLIAIVGVYYLNKQNDQSNTNVQQSDVSIQSEDSTLSELSQEEIKELVEFKYTDTVISPSVIANDPNTYFNKEITTKGWIVEISSGEYILNSIVNDDPYSLRIALTTDLDIKKYIISPEETTKRPIPAILTGTLKESGDKNILIFMVEDVSM
jgi:hypothetical protein